MRISADKSDPGYHEDRANVKVFLNGAEMTGCVTADEEAGEIVVYDTDALGRPKVWGDGSFKRKALQGEVKIVIPEDKRVLFGLE